MTLRARLAAAVERPGNPSSDYDLNETSDRNTKPLRDAAVLVPIVDRPQPAVILTKRAPGLKHHPGQVAFPGGKVDPSDADVIAAALREAREEIALDTAEVIGTLAPHETVTGFSVTPVLALVSPGFIPSPEKGEVAEVFEVPLAHLLDPANYLIQSRQWRGMPRYYFTVPWGPYYVWGATARMLRALADRMADGADQS